MLQESSQWLNVGIGAAMIVERQTTQLDFKMSVIVSICPVANHRYPGCLMIIITYIVTALMVD